MTVALTELEESFEELFHNAPFGYVTSSPDDRVTRVNDTFLELLGRTAEDVVGRPFAELLDPGTRLYYETRHVPVLRLEGRVREVALGLRRGDGSSIPVIANSVIVFAPDGSPREVRTAVVDASARTRYERELLAERRVAEAAARRVEVLQLAAAAFATSGTEEELAAALCGIVGEALDASATVIAIIEDGEFRVIGGYNPLDGLVPASSPAPSREAMISERPVVVRTPEEAEKDYPVVAAALRKAHLEGLVSFPLVRDGESLGVLVSFFGRRREMDDDTADLVVAICRQATQILLRVRLQAELARLAMHDPLTGLANRALLREGIGRAIASADRTGRPVAVMFVDLDGFKPVNDSFGHNTGDEVLRHVAARLRGVVREGDLLARFGGDEFIVVCEDTDAASAEIAAERVRAQMAEPFEGLPESLPISASIGVAVHLARAGRPVTTDEILDIADAAMYESKHAGGDRVTVRDC